MSTVLARAEWQDPGRLIDEPDEQALSRHALHSISTEDDALVLAGTPAMGDPSDPRGVTAGERLLDGGLFILREHIEPGWPQRAQLVESAAEEVCGRGMLSADEAETLRMTAAAWARTLRHPPSAAFSHRLVELGPNQLVVDHRAQSLAADAAKKLAGSCRISIIGYGAFHPSALDGDLAKASDEIIWFEPAPSDKDPGSPGVRRFCLPWEPHEPERGLSANLEEPYAVILADWPSGRNLLWPRVTGRALLGRFESQSLVFVSGSSLVAWRGGKPNYVTAPPSRAQLWGLMETAVAVLDMRVDTGLGREAWEAVQLGTPVIAPATHPLATSFILPYASTAEMVGTLAALFADARAASEISKRFAELATEMKGRFEPSALSRDTGSEAPVL